MPQPWNRRRSGRVQRWLGPRRLPLTVLRPAAPQITLRRRRMPPPVQSEDPREGPAVPRRALFPMAANPRRRSMARRSLRRFTPRCRSAAMRQKRRTAPPYARVQTGRVAMCTIRNAEWISITDSPATAESWSSGPIIAASWRSGAVGATFNTPTVFTAMNSVNGLSMTTAGRMTASMGGILIGEGTSRYMRPRAFIRSGSTAMPIRPGRLRCPTPGVGGPLPGTAITAPTMRRILSTPRRIIGWRTSSLPRVLPRPSRRSHRPPMVSRRLACPGSRTPLCQVRRNG